MSRAGVMKSSDLNILRFRAVYSLRITCAKAFGQVLTQYRLLELSDPSQRRPMLLRIGDPPVAPVPPQLVAEVLHAVGLCLRTDFTLGGEQSRGVTVVPTSLQSAFSGPLCLEDQSFATVIFPQLHRDTFVTLIQQN